MDSMMNSAEKKGGKPTTPEGWFKYHLNRLSNCCMANIIFGLTGLINNAVCVSDRQGFYSNTPNYFAGVWGGFVILLTTVIFFVGSSKKQKSYFKGLMFLQVLSIFCAVAMVVAGVRGMIIDFTTEWKVDGVNRPMDIVVGISGLFAFILTIIGADANGKLQKLPDIVWEDWEGAKAADPESARNIKANEVAMQAQAAHLLNSGPQRQTAWAAYSDMKNAPPPPAYENKAFVHESARL